MKTTKVLFFTLLFAAVLLPTGIKAQVTIGYDKAPEPFSVLELISGGDKGLRLPQLSTTAIDDLGEQIKTSLDANYKNLARGLIVYDSTLNCVKYWKGTDEVWVGIGCPSAPPLAPILADAQKVCGTTIADLEPSGLNWYAAATGGTALSGSTALVDGATYHASQTVSGVESTIRTAVTITLETNCAELSPTAYNIFSPVSVMYTYQYQDLELYKGVNTGGNATSFQWKVNRKNQATVVNIPAAKGGTAQTFRVPSNFGTVGSAWSAELNTLLGNVNKNDILIFTCEYTNPNTTTPQTVTTEIEFIKLDENNSVMFNGVKYYYVELDVPTSATSPDYSNSNGYLRILATNLGVENENAADIGDLYQWGRGGTADQTPDGHEHIVWGSTGTTSKTIDFATGTSGTQAYVGTANSMNPLNAGSSNFITGYGTWVNTSNVVTPWVLIDLVNLWNGTASQTGFNPCPGGWHIPTRYEWGAIATGSPGPATASAGVYPTDNNIWRFPSTNTDFGNSSHLGGVVVTAKTDDSKSIFLPAAGFRYNINGTLYNVGITGHYWASKYGDASNAYNLHFSASSMFVCNDYSLKAFGFSVRCVADQIE